MDVTEKLKHDVRRMYGDLPEVAIWEVHLGEKAEMIYVFPRNVYIIQGEGFQSREDRHHVKQWASTT